MKEVTIGFLLLCWFLLTVIACISVLGLGLIISDYGDRPTSWMQIGLGLKDKLIK